MHTKTLHFVKHSRKLLNLTQTQLGALVNKKRCNISNYETGRATPPGDVVLKIVQLRFPEICLSNAHSHISNKPELKKMQTKSQDRSVA